MLEEDLMDLQILKGVAHAEGVKLQIEYWNTLLLQLQEMVGLLDTCQEEVLFVICISLMIYKLRPAQS